MNAIVNSIPIDGHDELGKEYIKSGFAKPGDIASVVIYSIFLCLLAAASY